MPGRRSGAEGFAAAGLVERAGLLSGITGSGGTARCEAILERVKLPREHWSKRMGQYSKGMKQRVKLAQGLLHGPDLLVLDEPMNGLDPMGRQEMAGHVEAPLRKRREHFISSHILAELESLCKNILILNWGRVLASGSQKEIRSDLKNWSEELSIQCDAPEKLARRLFDEGVLLGFDLDLAVRRSGHSRERCANILFAVDGIVAGERRESAGDSKPKPIFEEYFR